MQCIADSSISERTARLSEPTGINDASLFESGLIRSGALNGVPVASVTYLGGADLDSQGGVDFVLGLLPELDAESARGQIDGLVAELVFFWPPNTGNVLGWRSCRGDGRVMRGTTITRSALFA